jgi:stage V sporulation protein G
MEITCVRIAPYTHEKLKAFATITIDDWLVIRGLKIIQGSKRLFVAMPNRVKPGAGYEDIVHPITVEGRNYLESVVLGAFQALPPVLQNATEAVS